MTATNTATTETTPKPATVDYKLEVMVIPVSDVDRAKAFYANLGWREDADFPIRDDFRVIQMTPPGSLASVIFGDGVTAAQPGSYEGLVLAVYDIDEARADLIARGVDVSELFHSSAFDRYRARELGPDPERKSYSTFASFSDPDGNTWVLQELKSPPPGTLRRWTSIAALADLLHETAEHHDPYEKSSPAARLVGLVRRLHDGPSGRRLLGAGLRARRRVHGNARLTGGTRGPAVHAGPLSGAGAQGFDRGRDALGPRLGPLRLRDRARVLLAVRRRKLLERGLGRRVSVQRLLELVGDRDLPRRVVALDHGVHLIADLDAQLPAHLLAEPDQVLSHPSGRAAAAPACR